MSFFSQLSRLVGGILLISGSCIGAAMLGLPIITGESGFIPSLAMYLVAWLFMLSTGLLLLEVNLWFSGDISIVTMARKTLGRWGEYAAWILYCFLFYCLLVAFISGSSSLMASLFPSLFRDVADTFIPSFVFTFVFAVIVYLGTSVVDWINRFFMLGLLGTYAFLIYIGIDDIDPSLFERKNWAAAPLALPAMVISFGYHNLIPTLTRYFNQDRKLLVQACFWGTLMTVLIYFLWQAVVLGIVPFEGESGLSGAFSRGESVPVVLQKILNESLITTLALYFAFYALITTFLGIGLGFVDFLADGFHVEKTPNVRKILCLAVFLPPFAITLIRPGIFLKALSLAGGFGAVALFGILPALMVWKGRYHFGFDSKGILPCGKTFLGFILACAFIIILIQFFLLFK